MKFILLYVQQPVYHDTKISGISFMKLISLCVLGFREQKIVVFEVKKNGQVQFLT